MSLVEAGLVTLEIPVTAETRDQVVSVAPEATGTLSNLTVRAMVRAELKLGLSGLAAIYSAVFLNRDLTATQDQQVTPEVRAMHLLGFA